MISHLTPDPMETVVNFTQCADRRPLGCSGQTDAVQQRHKEYVLRCEWRTYQQLCSYGQVERLAKLKCGAMLLIARKAAMSEGGEERQESFCVDVQYRLIRKCKKCPSIQIVSA